MRGYYIYTLNQTDSPYYYVIAMGEQSTGGYSISISDVKIDEENNVEVIVKETKPTGTVTMAFTYPTCCLELKTLPNNIIIKNTEGEIFHEIEKPDNLIIENYIDEDTIVKY